MHLTEIVLDGFKSYAKRTVITGFDREFNAITGLNGSGKSNILDSICFVLGISNLTQVRAANLNELIYKQGQAGVTKASVTLVFDNNDSTMSPHGYEQMTQITVTRQIAVGGRNKYMINGHSAQLQRVQNLFHSVQLNVNNPHFLIMQGRITKVLNMKPIEILGMIEEAAGTRMFETKKQNAVKTIEKKDVKLQEIDRVMKEEVTPRLEKLSAQRAQYLEFTSLNAEVESVGRIVQAYEYVCAQEAKAKCAKEQEADAAAKEELTSKLEAAEVEEKQLKKQHAETLARKEKESGKALKKCEEAEQEASKVLVKVEAEHASARKAYEADMEASKTIDADIKKIHTSQTKAQAEMDKAVAKAQEESDKAAKAEAAAAAAQTQYEAAMGLASSTGEGVKNLQGQLSDAAAAITKHQTEVKTSEAAKKHFGKELKDAEKKLGEARKSGGKQEKEHAKLAEEVAALRGKMEGLGYDEAAEAELTKQQQLQQKEASALQRQERELAQAVGNVDFRYSDPEKGFDRSRVKGTVASNLTVKDAANNTALEALAGGRLHQVIVDDEQTGMLLLSKGQLQRRVTLIPLTKIQPRPIPADRVSAAKQLVGASKAHLAVDLLDFDAVVAPAMQHIFGGTLVCADKEAARAICDKLGLKTVTLDGDLYDPSGTLTGGSRAKATHSMLARLTELGALRRKLSAVEGALGEVGKKLEALHKASEKAGSLQSELEVKQQQLDIHTETMRNSPIGQLVGAVEGLQAQLAEAEAGNKAASEALAAAKELHKKLEAQVKDFEGNREENMKRMKAEIAAAQKEATKAAKAQQVAQAAEQKAAAAMGELQKELAAAIESKESLTTNQEAQVALIAQKAEAEQQRRDEYKAAEAALRACQDALGKYDKECEEIGERREALDKAKADAQVELSKIEHRMQRFQKELQSADACVRELLKRHPWMEAEKGQFGVAGTEYDFKKRKPAQLQKELAAKQANLETLSKKINKKVLSMLESAEQEYADLMSKKDIVEKDKEKIGKVIDELAQKKIEALNKTWSKVNGDFGSIFSTLLPGARAKLEPQEGCPVEEGLIVKVGFGAIGGSTCVWKTSLQELSGGQRSLIALSLVLSLLRFKPAPIYILDEVDAALDLSHTQNIGKMIKAHFKQSQFLVVSLKEGMFNNANVIFRTKFVDGVSCVTRTVPSAAVAHAANQAAAEEIARSNKAKAGSGAQTARPALASKN